MQPHTDLGQPLYKDLEGTDPKANFSIILVISVVNV